VVGAQRNVEVVCIGADDDMEARRREIHDCIDHVDAGDGIVLLTDMFGGTPSNLAISMMDRDDVEVIAGVNLPMLVKLAKVRSTHPLADAVDCAQMAGRKYIAAASRVLHGCKRNGTSG
jgi:PTS system mannose-specific IIA component